MATAPETDDPRPPADPDAVERELRSVGESLAAAFPQGSRLGLRALDTRAMELATGDQELRAALFRFVDVVPACRSLDDSLGTSPDSWASSRTALPHRSPQR